MSAMTTDHASHSFTDAALLAPSLQQPIAVEGSDPSLATVILPAPPPLGFIRLPLNKRPGDLAKRPLPSFIPHTDPGSTYATYLPNPSMSVMTSSGLSKPHSARPKRGRTETTPGGQPPRTNASNSVQTPGPSTGGPTPSDALFDPLPPSELTIPALLPPNGVHFSGASSGDEGGLQSVGLVGNNDTTHSSPTMEPLASLEVRSQSDPSSSAPSTEPPPKRPRGRPRKVVSSVHLTPPLGVQPLPANTTPLVFRNQSPSTLANNGGVPIPETKSSQVPGTLVLNFRRDQRQLRLKPSSSTPLQPPVDQSISTVSSSIATHGATARENGNGVNGTGPMPFRNDDICACCSIPHSESTASPLSHFLYCDGCTRSFHMGCLDPPIVDEKDQPQPDKDWFCPSCLAERISPAPLPPNPGPFDFLSNSLEVTPPRTFQLPDDIRSYFKDVSTGKHGAYVNTSNVKQGKADRHGFLEDRDPTRLKDRNNHLITCFRCGLTALPQQIHSLHDDPTPPSDSNALDTIPTPDPVTTYDSDSSFSPPPVEMVSHVRRTDEKGKSRLDALLHSIPSRIISCDYCPAHWHMDCLDPPMVIMPSPLKKWMCPNHIEHVMVRFKSLSARCGVQGCPPARGALFASKSISTEPASYAVQRLLAFPKRRTPKSQEVVDVKERHGWNNGTIEVVPSAEEMLLDPESRYEEIWINAKKYMIPERTIRLDFLDKVARQRNVEQGWRARVLRHLADDSSGSSSLTSLSSSSDTEGMDVDTESDVGDSDSDEAAADARGDRLKTKLEELYKRTDAALSLLSFHDRKSPSAVPQYSTDALVYAALQEIASPIPRHRSSPSQSASNNSPVKAGSTATSFRIRLNKPTQSTSGTTDSLSQLTPNHSTSSINDSTGNTTPIVNDHGGVSTPTPKEKTPDPSSAKPLTPDEIQQLLHVRTLMKMKGEEKLLEFLNSS